jgi:hypothetical protein
VRALALVFGILIIIGGSMAGCSLGLIVIGLHEPPSPSWNFRPDVGATSHHQTPALTAGPHVVWIDQPSSGSPCTLTVRRQNGALVGTDQGSRLCKVSGDAQADEVWSLDAHGASEANGCLASDEPVVLPRSLKLGLSGAAMAVMLGVLLVVVGSRRRER